MLHTDWKTTVAGLVAALLPFAKGILPVALAPIVDAVATLALVLLGYFAADRK